MSSIELHELRTLSISNPTPGRPSFMAAASGVSRVGNGDRVVAIGDDENHFWEGSTDPSEPGVFTRIVPGTLSVDESQRKNDKADFEALTILPPFERNPYGALLAAGSGGMSWSGTRRSVGVAYTLDADHRIQGFPSKVDLTELHEFLEPNVIGVLNIEGMCVWGDRLILAQRGNSVVEGKPGVNALIHLSLEEVLNSLLGDLAIGELELQHVEKYELGYRVDGAGNQAKLDFTDLDHVSDDPHNRVVYTAASEVPDGADNAGEIAGSAIGVIDADGHIIKQFEVSDPSIKLEGIDARYNLETGDIELLLVADADDPEVAAPMMHAVITSSELEA